jgi:8-oxo-dGTP diphosphatase
MSLTDKHLHVAVGVIKNDDGRILISQRHPQTHQGGLWEFPGGKIESGEAVGQALKRELQEELAISAAEIEPLIKIRHAYPDVSVLLDVWTVTKFSGQPYGQEGQAIAWVMPNELKNYPFPDANLPIIRAAQLPPFYAILDDSVPALLFVQLNKILVNGIKLIQARLKNLSAVKAAEFMQQAMPLCKQHNAQLLINSGVAGALHTPSDGLHLTSHDLMQLTQRPNIEGWLAASCHNLAQLQQAQALSVDFVVLAPVLPTQTHPNAPTLGWEKFAELVNQVNLPVYALGGVTIGDKMTAQSLGAQGIAGIRTFLV